MDESAIDVTQRILNRNIVYGSSDNTQPQYLAANRSLNYATGGSITSPEVDKVSIIPFTINYKDTVGLFGKENHFVRVNVNIDYETAFKCFEEPGWECARISQEQFDAMSDYIQAEIDTEKDLTTVNTYQPAAIKQNSVAKLFDGYVSVDLENLKTGNKYIDSWFDVRLYTKGRQEHPYDKMYVRANDYFYIGFHARNTKRLPYNVKCVIGQEYISGLEPGAVRYKNVGV